MLLTGQRGRCPPRRRPPADCCRGRIPRRAARARRDGRCGSPPPATRRRRATWFRRAAATARSPARSSMRSCCSTATASRRTSPWPRAISAARRRPGNAIAQNRPRTPLRDRPRRTAQPRSRLRPGTWWRPARAWDAWLDGALAGLSQRTSAPAPSASLPSAPSRHALRAPARSPPRLVPRNGTFAANGTAGLDRAGPNRSCPRNAS